MNITKADVIAVLRRSNPNGKEQSIQLYAQSFLEYVEAVFNVEANGTVCAHPRTGQPIENPFCKVKAAAMSSMGKMLKQLDTDPLWKWLEVQNAPALEEGEEQ